MSELSTRILPRTKIKYKKCYKKHENEKKRVYEERIKNIEHSSFTLLILSARDGMAKQSTTFYKI